VLEISIIKTKNLVQDEEHKDNTFVSKIAKNTERYAISMQFLKIFLLMMLSIESFLFIQKYIVNYKTYFVCCFLAFSLIIVVFSEIIPKKIALFKSDKPRFMIMAYTLSFFVYPIYFFIQIINRIILKFFGLNTDSFEEKVSEEEIKALVETASEKGVFNDIEKDMINSIFSFDDITAKDIMVSRKDTYKIDIDEPFEKYIDEILESYYSRIPVYKEDIDDIIGILNVKDLTLEARKVGFENVDIEKLLQTPYFVPEMKNIDELFKEMQKLRNHMAILVDEYGGFSGIVTIEDMIEQIMGDINDEFDDEEISIQKISENVYAIDGTTEIREINKELNLNLENENYDTVSALIIEKLGYIPDEGEKPTVTIDNLLFKVELVSDNRIEKLKLIIKDLDIVENDKK
ncbi:MAG: HlyC/CorC family transporter, partial [Peptostreptococcaceae bacterium]|nr:HlyC/CorC family transporter [Peptostreptococcaceae bacterium]